MRLKLMTACLAFTFNLHVAVAADADGDGVPDAADNCSEQINPGQCDSDSDGFGNACDSDFDNNGFIEAWDILAFLGDFTSGVASGLGTDANCDGFVNVADFGPLLAQLERGQPGPSGLFCAGLAGCVDGDLDSIADPFDNCISTPNASQCDADADGYGNHCDADYNQDGQINMPDFAVFLGDFNSGSDAGSGTDHNCDGVVSIADFAVFLSQFGGSLPQDSALSCAGSSPCLDEDLDAVPDHLDNCTGVPNQDQADSDGDGSGDVCDVLVYDTVELSGLELPGPYRGFQAVRDGSGLIHGFHLAPDTDSSGVTQPNQRIVHVYETSPGGPLVSETLITRVNASGAYDPTSLALAVDRQGDVCIAYRVTTQFKPMFVGCLDSGPFAPDEVTGFNLRGSSDGRLAYDAQNQPHLFFYQHGFVNGANHRVRHVWHDGSTWWKEQVPMPPELLPPSVADAASDFACVAVDDDSIHVALSAFPDVICNTGPPCFEYDAELVYAELDSSGVWTSEVARFDLDEGVPSYDARVTGCGLGVDSEGNIDLLYTLGTGERSFSHRGPGGWEHSALGSGGDVIGLTHDDDDRVVGTSASLGGELLRVLDAAQPVEAYASTLHPESYLYGSAVFTDPSAAGDGTDCVILAARLSSLLPAELKVEIVRTEVEGCDLPFSELPRPDYGLP